MKNLFNSCLIAFSMYSKIPMPKSDWKKENMTYVMCFFPFVGCVIGGIVWLSFLLLAKSNMGQPFQTVVLLLLPVALTGGIHLDGFLDTIDALSSFQSKERKLEIMKDPHMGAFAVIGAIAYFFMAYGIWADVTIETIGVIACSFVLSRILSGLSVVCFPMAKESGLASSFANAAQKKTTRIVLVIYLLILCVTMLLYQPFFSAIVFATASIVYGYYFYTSKKNFGGITGDLAGYFLQLCELLVTIAVVIASKII